MCQKTRFFYVLYSDKTWFFDQSDRAQGPINIMKENKTFLVVPVSERFTWHQTRFEALFPALSRLWSTFLLGRSAGSFLNSGW